MTKVKYYELKSNNIFNAILAYSSILNMDHITIFDIDNWSAAGGSVLLDKLMEFGVIPKTMVCPQGHLMYLGGDEIDHTEWRCKKMYKVIKRKKRRCDIKWSIKSRTFFHNSLLSIQQILTFVNLWVSNAELNVITSQVMICRSTSLEWSEFCRETTYNSMTSNITPIGGPNETVEMNESVCREDKSPIDQRCVLGGIERVSGRWFMVPVENWDRDTLLSIIQYWIKPGTTIVTDCLRGDEVLTDEDFRHLRFDHNIQFIDPETGANADRIAKRWRISSKRRELRPGKLARRMFIRSCQTNNKDPFVEFLRIAGTLHYRMQPNSYEWNIKQIGINLSL